MIKTSQVAEALYLKPAAAGPRLCCVAMPREGVARGTVLLLPPFAEELNKTRRMCATLARRLAADGWRVVRVDLYGCGDSAGEFRDASWAQWIADLATEIEQCETPPWLWCVRAGALFVPELLSVRGAAGLLLWQPAVSGAAHLQQFLRLHRVAAWAGSGLAGAAMSDRTPTAAQLLERGECVEVAGYEVTPHLAASMREVHFSLPANGSMPVVWFEMGPTPDAPPSPASQRKVEALQVEGYAAQLEVIAGAPFWQSTEIVENESLLERSRIALASCSPR